MKTEVLFILVIFLFADIADSVAQSKLDGKWVDISTSKDTLTFLTVGEQDYVQVVRGSELRNGALRPKNGSGPYSYIILSGKISLRWTLSASTDYKDYYFKQTGDSLAIANFYDLDSKGTIRTFVEIK